MEVRRFRPEKSVPAIEAGAQKDELLVTQEESALLQDAIASFIKPVKLTLNTRFVEDKVAFKKKFRHPHVGKISLVSVTDFYRTPYQRQTFSELSDEERADLIEYRKNGGKVIMIRRTAPSKAFKKALEAYSEEYHAGFAMITDEILSEEIEEAELTDPEDLDPRQIARLELKRLAGKSIEKYAISPHVPKFRAARRALQRLENISDQYEIAYATDSTMDELSKKETTWAMGFVAFSAILPFILEYATKNFNRETSMVLSQGVGEAMNIGLSAVDRFAHSSLLAVVNYLKKGSSIKNRSIILGSNLIIATALSEMSIETRSLLYFLAIAPINSTIIALNEIGRRSARAKRFLEENPERKDAIIAQMPRILKLVTKVKPHVAVGIADYVENATAMGSLAGAYLSFFVLPHLEGIIPEPYIESASGVGFENSTGAIAGKVKDMLSPSPWEKFNEDFEEDKE